MTETLKNKTNNEESDYLDLGSVYTSGMMALLDSCVLYRWNPKRRLIERSFCNPGTSVNGKDLSKVSEWYAGSPFSARDKMEAIKNWNEYAERKGWSSLTSVENLVGNYLVKNHKRLEKERREEIKKTNEFFVGKLESKLNKAIEEEIISDEYGHLVGVSLMGGRPCEPEGIDFSDVEYFYASPNEIKKGLLGIYSPDGWKDVLVEKNLGSHKDFHPYFAKDEADLNREREKLHDKIRATLYSYKIKMEK